MINWRRYFTVYVMDKVLNVLTRDVKIKKNKPNKKMQRP